MRDPYSVLGVRRNAGPDEIKAAWRAVAKAVHPDQNKDDPLATQRFAEAGRAYEVLKDPKLRNRYDYARREAELRRMEEMKMDLKNYWWYLELRRFGTVPHAGFGIGLERTVAWICGLSHIRETIPYARMLNRKYP